MSVKFLIKHFAMVTMATFVNFVYLPSAYAANVDCSNQTIQSIIVNRTATILLLQDLTCPPTATQGHLCLDSAGTPPMTLNQSNRMYSEILARYTAGKPLTRLSYDNAIIVSGCGYPLVTEIR